MSRFVRSMFTAGLMALGATMYSGRITRSTPYASSPLGLGGLLKQQPASWAGDFWTVRATVVVDNRPGGVIPGEIVSQAAPDGYTVLVTGGTLWTGPLLQPAPYDPVKDFAPITLVATSPQLVVVHPRCKDCQRVDRFWPKPSRVSSTLARVQPAA